MAGTFLCVFPCKCQPRTFPNLVDVLPTAVLKKQGGYPHRCHTDNLVNKIRTQEFRVLRRTGTNL